MVPTISNHGMIGSLEKAGANREDLSWALANDALFSLIHASGTVYAYVKKGVPLRQLLDRPEEERNKILEFKTYLQFCSKQIPLDDFVEKYIKNS